jgi:hypothetical protein
MKINKILFSLSVLVCLFLATTMSAQATRTWVSGVGNDANPCSRTAPCKTFAGAISKTATCGEIDALDPAGYGAVTITKSITINGEGTMASILNPLVNGVIINITASDVCNTVILRHIDINGGGSIGLDGIKDVSSINHSLHVEHVAIQHQARGLEIVNTAAPMKLFMKDVDVRHTTAHGIDIHPNGGQTVTLALHDVRSRQSTGDGIRFQNNAKGTITESQFQSNTQNGGNIFGSSVSLMFVNTNFGNNGQVGLVNAAGATTFIDGCSFSFNGTFGINNTGSTMNGFGNNSFGGNTSGDVSGTAVATLPHP